MAVWRHACRRWKDSGARSVRACRRSQGARHRRREPCRRRSDRWRRSQGGGLELPGGSQDSRAACRRRRWRTGPAELARTGERVVSPRRVSCPPWRAGALSSAARFLPESEERSPTTLCRPEQRGGSAGSRPYGVLVFSGRRRREELGSALLFNPSAGCAPRCRVLVHGRAVRQW